MSSSVPTCWCDTWDGFFGCYCQPSVWTQVSHLLFSALSFLLSYLSLWFVFALGFLFCFFSGCFLFGLLLVDDIWFGFYCSVLVHARQVLDHWQQPQPPLRVSVTLLVCKWWAIYLVPKVKSTFSHQFHIHLKTPSLPLSLGCNLCQSLSREVESMWQWWREVKASFSNWAGICGPWLFHSVHWYHLVVVGKGWGLMREAYRNLSIPWLQPRVNLHFWDSVAKLSLRLPRPTSTVLLKLGKMAVAQLPSSAGTWLTSKLCASTIKDSSNDGGSAWGGPSLACHGSSVLFVSWICPTSHKEQVNQLATKHSLEKTGENEMPQSHRHTWFPRWFSCGKYLRKHHRGCCGDVVVSSASMEGSLADCLFLTGARSSYPVFLLICIW